MTLALGRDFAAAELREDDLLDVQKGCGVLRHLPRG
jgi:hypothetical protein